MAGVTKIVREHTKKANLHNPKLRDCRIHYCDVKNPQREETCIFITEGISASGSITKIRDVNTQAVFSLKGKILNTYGLTKPQVFENAEICLLQAALNIESGLDKLRYNKIIIATDADDDGMHIRLLVLTFFLHIYPELVRQGHVYILQTPLYRVRNRRTKIKNRQIIEKADLRNGNRNDYITRYCYNEEEHRTAITELGPEPEITRFKGLGEISPEEFATFIGPGMRLEQVRIGKDEQIDKILKYYMGKNTMERQRFIMENLIVEEYTPVE
jgi:topoisomerase-4 subunit B